MVDHFFFSTSSFPHVKSNGGITVAVVKRGGEKQESRISLTDQSSIPSISVANGHKQPDFKVEQFSPSNTMTSPSVESFHEPETQDQPTMPVVVIVPTAPPATVPPHFPETTRSTLRACSSYDAV
jgi:hypothetical protein